MRVAFPRRRKYREDGYRDALHTVEQPFYHNLRDYFRVVAHLPDAR